MIASTHGTKQSVISPPDTEIDSAAQYELDSGINNIVDTTDPTHGKYSEWLVQCFLKMWATDIPSEQRRAIFYILDGEDVYKTTEALATFHKHKHLLDPSARDIMKYDLSQLIATADTLSDTVLHTPAEIAKLVKANETIKLVDNLDGWTVIVPLTKNAARIYGAGTKWCTSAREEDHNAFDAYNAKAPLFMFMHGNKKYQAQFLPLVNRKALPPSPYFDVPRVHFMNAQDEKADLTEVPYKVWVAAYEADTTNKEIQDSQTRMSKTIKDLAECGDNPSRRFRFVRVWLGKEPAEPDKDDAEFHY